MDRSVAAIILTHNEEKHIQDCLQSLTWCQEIWVVDSQSTDLTPEICRQYTPNFAVHPFVNYADQRNWALDTLPIRSQWIFFIDSTERVPADTQQTILATLQEDNGKYAGYLIPRLQYFWGKPLFHADAWPQKRLILFQKGLGRFLDEVIVHERVELAGKTSTIEKPIISLTRDSLSSFIATFNKQSDLEAQRMFATGLGMFSPKYRSYSKWNQLLKNIFRYLPFKPIVRFFYLYVVKQGFRDGYRGYLYAVMLSFYVFASYAKLWELRNSSPNSTASARNQGEPPTQL